MALLSDAADDTAREPLALSFEARERIEEIAVEQFERLVRTVTTALMQRIDESAAVIGAVQVTAACRICDELRPKQDKQSGD